MRGEFEARCAQRICSRGPLDVVVVAFGGVRHPTLRKALVD
jgi:hypothetical protein